MGKWIYRYLRADDEEIDMGPYKTEDEAQTAKDEHTSYGAMTCGPMKVADDYRLFTGE